MNAFTISSGAFAFLAWLGGGSSVWAQSYPAYHDISDKEAAQTEAQQRHLPLAWLGALPNLLQDNTSGLESSSGQDMSQSSLPDLNSGSGPNLDQPVDQPASTPSQPVYFKLTLDEQREMTQSIISLLQGKAVIVVFDGSNMSPVPPIVHAQDHFSDDGALQGGAWEPPKVVFTDPAISHTLGRVAARQMKNEGDAPLLLRALAAIQQNPAVLDPAPEPPNAGQPGVVFTAAPPPISPAAAPAPVTAPVAASTPAPVPAAAPAQAVSPPAAQPEPDAVSAAPAVGMPDASSPDDDIDMSPDERAISDFIHQDAIFLGVGAAAAVIGMFMLRGSADGPPPRSKVRGRY